MVTIKTFKQAALLFPQVYEQAHFDKASFRVANKIFATLDMENERVCVRLSLIDQDVFSTFDKSVIFPVPNKWGKQGWTFINLQKVRKGMLVDALTASYCQVAPKKLSSAMKKQEQNSKKSAGG